MYASPLSKLRNHVYLLIIVTITLLSAAPVNQVGFSQAAAPDEVNADWFGADSVPVAPIGEPIPAPQLAISFQTLSMTVAIMDVAPLSLTAFNSGDAPLNDYYLALYLPIGLEPAAADSAAAEISFDEETRLLLFEPETLAPGASSVISFTLEVGEQALA
jgi:hypothetical protein